MSIRADPDDASLYLKRAELFPHIKQDSDAISDLTTAIRIDPTNTEAYLTRGNLFSKQMQYQDALADYSQAVSMAQNDKLIHIARFNRGYVNYCLKDYEAALADFFKAIELQPQDPYSHMYVGYIYEAQGQNAKALESLRRSMQLTGKVAVDSTLRQVKTKIRQLEKQHELR